MADTKVSALAEISIPDFADDLYIVNDTGPTSNKCGTDRLFGLGGFLPGGRLTLETGVGVSSTDQSAKSTLYYTPHIHNRVRVWDGTRWLYKTFAEISLALTLTSGKRKDVFLDDDAATLVLSADWTDDVTRADALGTQDGVLVLNSDKTKLWLGSISASGTDQTSDTLAYRGVYNYYNQVLRRLFKGSTSSHTYNSATARSWNNSAANQIEIMLGLTQTVWWTIHGDVTVGAGGAGFPIVQAALDWTTGVMSGQSTPSLAMTGSAVRFLAGDSAVASLFGYHYIRATESSATAQMETLEEFALHAFAKM